MYTAIEDVGKAGSYRSSITVRYLQLKYQLNIEHQCIYIFKHKCYFSDIIFTRGPITQILAVTWLTCFIAPVIALMRSLATREEF